MKTTSFFFWLNRIAGAIVLLTIALHLFIQHFAQPRTELNFERVMRYLKHPFFLFLDGLLLIAVLYKALYGLRSVLYDFSFLHKYMKYVTIVLLIIGVVFAFLGIDTLVKVTAFK